MKDSMRNESSRTECDWQDNCHVSMRHGQVHMKIAKESPTAQDLVDVTPSGNINRDNAPIPPTNHSKAILKEAKQAKSPKSKSTTPKAIKEPLALPTKQEALESLRKEWNNEDVSIEELNKLCEDVESDLNKQEDIKNGN